MIYLKIVGWKPSYRLCVVRPRRVFEALSARVETEERGAACSNNTSHLLNAKEDSVSTPTSSSLCLSLFDSVYLSLCISLPLYLISLLLSVFSLCGSFSPSISLPLLIFFFLIYSPLSLFEASQRAGWGWVWERREKWKYKTEERGEYWWQVSLLTVFSFEQGTKKTGRTISFAQWHCMLLTP